MTPDTAHEAITQADRDLEEWFLRRLGGGAKAWRGKIARMLARHRRLNSYSAGEGMREACLRVVDEHQPGGEFYDCMHDVASIRLSIAHEIRALTPPSDAGSTTRSGGERTMIAEAEESCARVIQKKLDEHSDEVRWALEYGRPLDPVILNDIVCALLSPSRPIVCSSEQSSVLA